MFESVDAVAEGLRAQGYLTGRDVATQVYLASRLGKPLLVEGPPGSGRSALARSVAAAGGVPFFEVACSPQITADDATHRWDVDRQLLHLREAAAAGRNMEHPRAEAFSETFLIPGPVISAFRESGPSVLLFRDIALAPAPFLLWLGRVFDDSAVDIPALGRISAPVRPVVFLTANADRPISPEIAQQCARATGSFGNMPASGYNSFNVCAIASVSQTLMSPIVSRGTSTDGESNSSSARLFASFGTITSSTSSPASWHNSQPRSDHAE